MILFGTISINSFYRCQRSIAIHKPLNHVKYPPTDEVSRWLSYSLKAAFWFIARQLCAKSKLFKRILGISLEGLQGKGQVAWYFNIIAPDQETVYGLYDQLPCLVNTIQIDDQLRWTIPTACACKWWSVCTWSPPRSCVEPRWRCSTVCLPGQKEPSSLCNNGSWGWYPCFPRTARWCWGWDSLPQQWVSKWDPTTRCQVRGWYLARRWVRVATGVWRCPSTTTTSSWESSWQATANPPGSAKAVCGWGWKINVSKWALLEVTQHACAYMSQTHNISIISIEPLRLLRLKRYCAPKQGQSPSQAVLDMFKDKEKRALAILCYHMFSRYVISSIPFPNI